MQLIMNNFAPRKNYLLEFASTFSNSTGLSLKLDFPTSFYF
jgi:hypothetical protein